MSEEANTPDEVKEEEAERADIKQQGAPDKHQDVLKALEEPETIPQSLNLGHHNQAWYYGRRIEANGSFMDIVVTSERCIYKNDSKTIRTREGELTTGTDEIRKVFGLDYLPSSIISEGSWSKAGIKAYLEGKATPPEPKELFEMIKGEIQKYVYFQNPLEADVCACFVLASYTYQLFGTLGYLYLTGQRGSGKTTCAEVIGAMAFNTENTANHTPATLFRTIQARKGLVILDEFEDNISKEKKAELMQLLNAGNRLNAKVFRTEKRGDNFELVPYYIGCPKIICNIFGLNSASTLSRCITITMMRAPKGSGQSKKKFDHRLASWRDIRDACHLWALKYWPKLYGLNEASPFEDLNNRKEDNWRPLLVVANSISPELGKEMLNYAVQADEMEDLGDEEAELFAALFNLSAGDLSTDHKPDKEGRHLWAAKDITDHIEFEFPFDIRNKGIWLGRRLSRYPLFRIRNREGTFYDLSLNKLMEVMERYGYPIPNEYRAKE